MCANLGLCCRTASKGVFHESLRTGVLLAVYPAAFTTSSYIFAGRFASTFIVRALVTITLLERLDLLFCTGVSRAVRSGLIPFPITSVLKAFPKKVSPSSRIYCTFLLY
jgi:hypothetical protein